MALMTMVGEAKEVDLIVPARRPWDHARRLPQGWISTVLLCRQPVTRTAPSRRTKVHWPLSMPATTAPLAKPNLATIVTAADLSCQSMNDAADFAPARGRKSLTWIYNIVTVLAARERVWRWSPLSALKQIKFCLTSTHRACADR